MTDTYYFIYYYYIFLALKPKGDHSILCSYCTLFPYM